MTLSSKRRGSVPSRQISRVLVVGKYTKVMDVFARQDARAIRLLQSGDASVGRMEPAHEEHLASLQLVLSELKARNIESQYVRVDMLGGSEIERTFDLAIAVGGDGTVIDVARRSRHVPVLGVNSASQHGSRGHFCMAVPGTFGDLLDRIRSGALAPLRVQRLRAFIDGIAVGQPVLNEVFAENATGTASYILRIDGEEEVHMSDGVMIGTAAGSTAWSRWYYGHILDIADRRMHYVVRGPNPDHHLRMVKGIVRPNAKVQVISKMADGYVAVDGRRNAYPFPIGSVLEVRPARRDIVIFADPNCNDAYRVPTAASTEAAA